jgi:S-adenosylmethionine:tRNA ribosyltransferase-isomerase
VKISDLDYDLPEELIAQEPLPNRDASRLMLVDKGSGVIQDLHFRELPAILHPADFLVLNDSAVFPARLLGRRPGGGRVELLLLRPDSEQATGALNSRSGGELPAENHDHALWEALARPKRKLRRNMELIFSDDLRGRVADVSDETVKIQFRFSGDFSSVLDRTARVPLPPYIRRPDTERDRDRYQTVYAARRGSIAAPTAGLHFTPGILNDLRRRGIHCFFVTLHVGYGTFRPVKSASIEQHRIDAESFSISANDAAGIREALQSGRRMIAVGTTTTRMLEHWKRSSPKLRAIAGQTDLFIYPPFDFKLVKGLLTNFHLPRSSLFALVCAFLGTELARQCYRHAVERHYRFYSYGDCMLIV